LRKPASALDRKQIAKLAAVFADYCSDLERRNAADRPGGRGADGAARADHAWTEVPVDEERQVELNTTVGSIVTPIAPWDTANTLNQRFVSRDVSRGYPAKPPAQQPDLRITRIAIIGSTVLPWYIRPRHPVLHAQGTLPVDYVPGHEPGHERDRLAATALVGELPRPTAEPASVQLSRLSNAQRVRRVDLQVGEQRFMS